MTPQQIAADIARGEFLKNRIEQDKTELKLIEKRLETAGLAGPHVPLKDATREGKQRLLDGEGKILPVRFESDILIGSFGYGTALHQNLKLLCDTDGKNTAESPLFEQLFKEVHSYEKRHEDGHKFRELVRKSVANEKTFHDIIGLLKSRDKKTGIVKSKTVIAWNEIETSNPSES